ncbi:MAG: hypothetical protein A2494_01195 [Candidatus Lloydbacteria bacterium RIFOXYC12_FULL_46_25]|uniref:Uncharacterized protein n=1 Tax=Candidatus Lloydbacteria bacterium RIFOXYC12_FULL_46_25 TaxID=1798670 RepID=A0A1G2DZH1_9BACT|nr:MAG: hypothetical protein A2494_01195 [Candidatus Lloydbacteria bacterium RIFOXYC12_FULL_46_25]
MNTACPKTTPYTYHTEREARYMQELLEIERSGRYRGDIDGLKAQALENACSSELIDATMNLLHKRVRIAYKDRIFGTEHAVSQIVRVNNVRADERACFGIVCKNDGKGSEETLPIFPSTRIFILKEESAVVEPAMHYY